MIVEEGMEMSDLVKYADREVILDPMHRNTFNIDLGPKCRACRTGLGVHDGCDHHGQAELPRCTQCWLPTSGAAPKHCHSPQNHREVSHAC